MSSEQQRAQRFLTVDLITKRRLNVPVIWLQPEAAIPSDDDALKAPDTLACDPNDWGDTDRNLGARLGNGFIELGIKAPDEIWPRCFFEACASLKIDARAAYGPLGQPVSSILFQIADPSKIDRWEILWPHGQKDKAGQWVETKFTYSQMPTPRSKPVWHDSRPLPGSRFGGKLIVWRPGGKPAADLAELALEDFGPQPVAATSMESICRATAFATLAYWIRIYLDGLDSWDESLTRALAGWTARQVREGADINAHGKSLEGVCWAPVDSAATAGDLLAFCVRLGAGRNLGVAFEQAEAALERNPDAPVPGWGMLETLFGPQGKVAIRHAFRAGTDINAIERMSELYIYDRTAHEYLDRDELLKGLAYVHKHDGLVERHKVEKFFVTPIKALNPFDVYSGSSLRTDVQHREFRPGFEPGAILRFSPVHGLLNGEDRHPDEFRLLNTFPGFTIKPIAAIDEAVMRSAITMLDTMLGLLTRDNDAQILWLKKFIAWIAQHPEIKSQVCPIIVGGQGIGKSLFGDNLMRALFGGMAGSADAAALTDNKFLITPFIGKLITFIDEVKLESVGAINIIKKLVRSDQVSGQIKFGHQHDHYIPSRLLIASNQPHIGLTPEDAADRCFFFIISWTAENKRMTDREFQTWSLTLKPFYSRFVEALENVVFRRHLMRYFIDLEVTRAELEDLRHSSRDDENVIRATMSKSREVARAIVADARVLQGMDITTWFNLQQLRDAIRRIDGPRTKVEASQVLMEYERAGVLERVRGDLHKFLFRYGTLVQKLGEAHSLPITNSWDYEPDDWGENDVLSVNGGRQWRGNRQQGKQQERRYAPNVDPDYEPPF